MRIHQLAKKLNLDSKKIIKKLKELGVEVKSHMSSLDEDTIEILKEEFKGSVSEREKEKEIRVPLTVRELAGVLDIKANELIKKLMRANIFVLSLIHI